jgi:hypothetical protein
MNSLRKSALLGALLFGAHAAMAQTMAPRTAPQSGQWSLTPIVGADFNASGTFNNSKTGSVSRTVSTSLGTFSGTATANIASHKFSDVYDTPIVGGVSVGYGLWNDDEVFGGFSYEHASGRQVTSGTVSVTGTLNGAPFSRSNAPVSDKPDDLDQYNFEVGYRHFFETGTAWLPYVSASAGVAHVSGIKVDVVVNGIDVGKTSFYDGSTIAVVGLGAGITYAVAPGAAVGIETGLRYNSGLSGDSAASGVAATGDRLTVPLLATGRFTF